MDNRTIKFSMRITAEEYELFKKCAEIDNRTMSNFVRHSALKLADEILNEHNAQEEE